MKQQVFDFPPHTTTSFDNFVVCAGNRVAYEFAVRIASAQDPANLLYLYGPKGSGKTHLLKAIQGAVSQPDCPVPVVSFREPFTIELLRTRCDNVTALILDDLDAVPPDDDVRRAIWQLFNDFHGNGRVIALAGALPPRELAAFDEHLISRLVWGLVAEVDVSDDASRRLILHKIAADRQVRVPDDVMEFLLKTVSRETGALIAAFESIYRCSLAEQRKITVSFARSVVGGDVAT